MLSTKQQTNICKRLIKYHNNKLKAYMYIVKQAYNTVSVENIDESCFIKTTPIIIDGTMYLIDKYNIIFTDNDQLEVVGIKENNSYTWF